MGVKKAVLTPPSLDAINTVLKAADNSSRINGETSRHLDKSIREVRDFFQSLLNPQASANAGGNSSDQSHPAGLPMPPL